MSSSEKPGVLHVYDDIEEMDNHMPNWWLFILFGTILFAAGYWYYYHVAELGPSSGAAYAAEAEAFEKRTVAEKPDSDMALLLLAKDAQVVEQGQQAYMQTCAACHGARGEGVIGPNLTDNAWLHGGKPMDIHKVVAEGVVAKGMPAWERTLGAERVRSVVAYLLTLKNTNVPGRPPQGEPEP
jgi:cytochrome c oxidase cbb3-type subunit III